MKLVDGIVGGNRVCLARSITLVENEDSQGEEILRRVYGRVGRASRVGITGPPGSGKSTLVRAMTETLTADDRTVGIIAVDPSSPFTGGALLGDRVRMHAVALNDKVFIRSMASRGALGGLALTTQNAADLLDAFGRDVILLETVGVGQSEVEIADAADTTVVVLSPESGDGIQAMKAGLMEIADIIVVNKADREGVDRFVTELSAILAMREDRGMGWDVPILRTVALRDLGIPELLGAIEDHGRHLSEKGLLVRRRAEILKRRILRAAGHLFRARVLDRIDDEEWTTLVRGVLDGRSTPATAAARIVDRACEA